MLKTHPLEVRRNFIALGCPINDVLDFGGPFLPLGWDSFFKRGSFSTGTSDCNSYRVQGGNLRVCKVHTQVVPMHPQHWSWRRSFSLLECSPSGAPTNSEARWTVLQAE